MLKWIRAQFGAKDDSANIDADKVINKQARRELQATVEALLLAHHAEFGADSLLEPALRLVVVAEGVRLAMMPIADAICEVHLRELPTVLSYLVVREDTIAIPRDVVADLAFEATQVMTRRINALD